MSARMDKDFGQAVCDVVRGVGVVYFGLLNEYVTVFITQVLAT